VRVHAEQVAHTGIAEVAAGLGAISADHLERIDAAGIAALAAAGTVGVLLPAAMLYLRDPAPPVAALRAAGVPLAVATDYNPGTSPSADLWLAATLSTIALGLTVEEAVLGITRHAARAVGRPELGQIREGGPADLAIVEPAAGFPATAAGLVQPLGGQRVRAVVASGRIFA
jgi:imidazolonepropionase